MSKKFRPDPDNTNCLKDMVCPKCGHTEDFIIGATCLVVVTDDGTDDPSHFEWEPDSYCECRSCNHHGDLDDFTVTTD